MNRTIILSTLLIIVSTCSLFIDKILPAQANKKHKSRVDVAAVSPTVLDRFDTKGR